jgi:hypothetical protein
MRDRFVAGQIYRAAEFLNRSDFHWLTDKFCKSPSRLKTTSILTFTFAIWHSVPILKA